MLFFIISVALASFENNIINCKTENGLVVCSVKDSKKIIRDYDGFDCPSDWNKYVVGDSFISEIETIYQNYSDIYSKFLNLKLKYDSDNLLIRIEELSKDIKLKTVNGVTTYRYGYLNYKCKQEEYEKLVVKYNEFVAEAEELREELYSLDLQYGMFLSRAEAMGNLKSCQDGLSEPAVMVGDIFGIK